MATAVFLLTLSFAYILLGTCAQFAIALFTSDPLLHLHWHYLPFSIILQSIFICLFFVRYSIFDELKSLRAQGISSGFRRDTFVFLYPFLLTILLHLCTNAWYTLSIVHLRKYQSIEMQSFFDYCSKDVLEMTADSTQCTCMRENNQDKYTINMSCMRVKLVIELIQLMPFIR